MASTGTPAKTIALIHNTALPHPLGNLSTAIASHAHRVYFSSSIPPNYQIQTIDLAEFNLPTSERTSPAPSPLQSEDAPSHTGKSAAEWAAEMSKHSGLILLFPYHTWSNCNALKSAISLLPVHDVAHKPVLLMGFGKEEPFHPSEYGRTWKRKSFGMMGEFLSERKMRVWESTPEFEIYSDYWEDWVGGGTNAGIGGQQAEAWESPAWNRCVTGIGLMVKDIEGKKAR